MSDYIGETYPKARKDHQCELCGYPIPKGTVHTARQGKDDGRAYTFRMHDFCESLTREWDEEEWEYSEPWRFREIVEFIKRPATSGVPLVPPPSAPAMRRGEGKGDERG